MRILICGLNFAPEMIGIGKYTTELAEYLHRSGHSVKVITAPPYYPQWKIFNDYSSRSYCKELWREIPLIRCPIYVPKQPTSLSRIIHLVSFGLSSLPALFSQFFWKPDLIFAVAPTLLSAPGGIFLSWMTGGKTWLHIQDFEFDAAFQMQMLPRKGILYFITHWFEGLIIRQFDRCSTISTSMIEVLRKKGVLPEKAILFPNWVDTENIYPMENPNPLRKEMGISDDKFVILYAGNIGKKQGLEIIVTAAKKLINFKNILFLIAGEGSHKKELVQKAAGVKNLMFCPLQKPDRLNELLNLADIHILPQRLNTTGSVMPSKLTGMLASGKPIIAMSSSNTDIFKELNGVIKLIPPEDPISLVEAIHDLSKNQLKRKKMGIYGRKYAENNLSKEKVLSDVLLEINKIEVNNSTTT